MAFNESSQSDMGDLLSVRGLHTHLATSRGLVKAVSGVSFSVREGERVAVVGESGSGKTITALSVLGLLPQQAQVVSGSVHFAGRDLTAMNARDMAKLRGKELAVVLQDPMSALNPLRTIRDQVAESLLIHDVCSRRQADARVLELLDEVGLPNPREIGRRYPFQLSGGMLQRAVIASAIACGPRLLIADEPTTALDATLAAQNLELIQRMSSERKMSVLLITHDMGVVARFAERVIVMYAGRVVEQGGVDEIFYQSGHPYAKGLIASIPGHAPGQSIAVMPGRIPDPDDLPPGCVFGPRCSYFTPKCASHEPPLLQIAGKSDHISACYYRDEVAETGSASKVSAR